MTAENIATGKVIAFRNDRLGGRLLMLVNAMRLARETGVSFQVHWHQGTELSAIINDPTEFFDADFVARHFIDRSSFLALRGRAFLPQQRRDLDLAGFRAALNQGACVLIDEGFGFPAYSGEDPAEVTRAGAALWREVPLAPAVAKVLSQIRATIGPNTTAYHIRRGDILTMPRVMNRPWPGKYVYDEAYQTHIEATLATGARPILFSDDAGTIARFKDRYPALIPAATLFDAGSVTPGQADFLELLALASCSRIVAPPHSAFSSGAAALGEVPISDIEQALSPDQQQAAGNRLYHRLANPDATSALGPGDTGQRLAHLDKFLAGNNRLSEYRPVLDLHLRAGLEVSFLFPRLVELNLLADDPKAAIDAAKLMETRLVYHRPDYAKGQILHAFACMAENQLADCARQANIALWHDPAGSFVAEGLGALYAAGVLNDSNALPFSPAARAMWSRPGLRLPDCKAIQAMTVICAKDSRGRALVPGIDPVIWDWAPFMRSFARGGLAKHRSRAVYERGLRHLATTMPGPDTESLIAVYDMHVGEKDDWLARLIALGAGHPEDATVQHRLSLAATLARDFKTAGTAAERAAEIAIDAPAHILWRALTRIRQQRFRLAMRDIRTGLDAGLAFPVMSLRLAMAAEKAGHPNVEHAAVEEGLRIAPRDMQLRFYRAQSAVRAGKIEAALADLDLLMNNDIVAPQMIELRQACLVELARGEPLASDLSQTGPSATVI